MIEQVVDKRVGYRECVGWLCHILSSESTNSGQLSSLRKQSAELPSPMSWWLLARLEHNKLKYEIGENSQRSWHLLLKALALLTLSGTPRKSAPDTPDTPEPDAERSSELSVDVKESSFNMPLRTSLHQPARRLGAALYAAGYSERRLAALLNSRESQFNEQLIRACRFLLAKKESFDCRELADLIFQQDPVKKQYDRVRQKIAQAYFRTAVKKDAETTENY